MALVNNTLDKLLDAIQAVLEADLQGILDDDNTEMGWSLVAPRTYLKGQQAKVVHAKTPALFLWCNLEQIAPRSQGSGDHECQVVFSLAIGASDVKSGADPNDLYNAIVRYGSRIMLVLQEDINELDATSTLRAVGAWRMVDGVSFWQPLIHGSTTSSQYGTAQFTAKFTQRRATTRS